MNGATSDRRADIVGCGMEGEAMVKLVDGARLGRFSLEELAKAPSAQSRRLNATGNAALLTHPGRSQLVVLDVSACRKLLQKPDETELLRGLKRSIKDMRAGRVRPAADVITDLIEDVRAVRT